MAGTVPKTYWVLTREQFLQELDQELNIERAKRVAKYDRGAEKYGRDVNLFDRDFNDEADDEETDRRNYRTFERVKARRMKALVTP